MRKNNRYQQKPVASVGTVSEWGIRTTLELKMTDFVDSLAYTFGAWPTYNHYMDDTLNRGAFRDTKTWNIISFDEVVILQIQNF